MPERTFRELADNAPAMLWRSNAYGSCDWFNRQWLDYVGLTLSNAVKLDWTHGVHPEDVETCQAERESAMCDQTPFELTYRRKRADGDWGWLLDKATPAYHDGEFIGYYGSCTDISAQQETYRSLQRAYRQRDALIREVYHRAKNTLQQIEGLIALEHLRLKDPDAQNALRDLSSRVRTMGLVHHMLLRSDDLNYISARDFVTELCAAIGEATAAEEHGIRIDVAADDVQVDIERAVLKGLIINELVSNSLKHAFPDGRNGVISVAFGMADARTSFVSVSDDGVGMPTSFEDGDAAGAGLMLIRGLVDQLNGSMSVSGPPGTSIRISFLRKPGEGE